LSPKAEQEKNSSNHAEKQLHRKIKMKSQRMIKKGWKISKKIDDLTQEKVIWERKKQCN